MAQPQPFALPSRIYWRKPDSSADSQSRQESVRVTMGASVACEECPLVLDQQKWSMLPKRLHWGGLPAHEGARVRTSDAVVLLFSLILFCFLPNRIDWGVPGFKVFGSLAPFHLVASVLLFSLGTLLIAGPDDLRAPILIKIGHGAATTAQIMLVVLRWRVVHARTASPGLQEAMSYVTPLLNAIAGTILTVLLCGGRLGSWGMMRGRKFSFAAIGFGSVLTLWLYADAESDTAMIYPPGPTTMRLSLATWASILCLGLVSNLSRRRWAWQQLPESLRMLLPRSAAAA